MSSLKGSKKEGAKYINPVPTDMSMSLSIMWDTLKRYRQKIERVPAQPIGPFITDPTVYISNSATGLRITWIGHSSLIIEIDGKRLLTDPVWAQRASFVSWAGPKRFFDPPLALAALPALDAIILSHDHYDHLDVGTIKQLTNSTVPFYCSMGVGSHLKKWGIGADRIHEMDWGDTVTIGSDLHITACPARHFSGRGITGRNETLWSSFVIKGNKHNIFFGADSGFFPGFKDIGDAYGPFDLTMLEIGAYDKNWPDIHMGPDNASNAHLMLRGKVMMPLHWGTFSLAPHPWKEPVELLLQYAKERGISLFLPRPGEPTDVISAGYNSKWWEK